MVVDDHIGIALVIEQALFLKNLFTQKRSQRVVSTKNWRDPEKEQAGSWLRISAGSFFGSFDCRRFYLCNFSNGFNWFRFWCRSRLLRLTTPHQHHGCDCCE